MKYNIIKIVDKEVGYAVHNGPDRLPRFSNRREFAHDYTLHQAQSVLRHWADANDMQIIPAL